MKHCTNSRLGSLLHAYELNTLSEEEIEQFEIHLLECEFCFAEARNFAAESSLLASDKAVKDLISGLQDNRPLEREAKMRFWHLLWPSEKPYFLRPALFYFIILLMIVPVFRSLLISPKQQVRAVQVINLLPIRSADNSILKQSGDDEGLINFVFDGAEEGKSYIVEIKSVEGDLIYMDSDFRNFDSFQTGRLVAPISKMKVGDYILTITDPRAKPPYDRKEYSFKIVR